MQGLKLFGVLLIGTLLVFLTGQFGPTFVADKILTKNFQSETLIGTELVENKSRAEAINELELAVETWREKGMIYLEWSGEIASIDKKEFEFHIEKSVEEAIDGNGNTLFVTLPDSVFLKTIEQLTGNSEINTEVYMEKLKIDIVSIASKLIEEDSNFPILDYFFEVSSTDEVLHEENLMVDADILVEMGEISVINLEPGSTFSLEDWLIQEGITLSQESGGILATLLYQLALPTNVEIVERHISKELPEYAEAGYEAAYSKGIMDLQLFNPNNHVLTIDVSIAINSISGGITGQPLAFSYEIIEEKIETFEPKTIVQYSPIVQRNQKQVKEAGKSGEYAVIVRNALGSDGEILDTTLIAQDFYAPVHRVEVHSLIKPEVPTMPESPNNPIVTAPDSNSGSNNTGGTNSGSNNGTNNGNSNNTGSNNNGGSNTENTGTTGNTSNSGTGNSNGTGNNAGNNPSYPGGK
ncbi:MAG: VanW family protein [Bacillota bacterium]